MPTTGSILMCYPRGSMLVVRDEAFPLECEWWWGDSPLRLGSSYPADVRNMGKGQLSKGQ